MGTYELEQIDVRGDGRVILYKRPGLKKPKWQARISVPNATGYKVVSTKTADVKEAERFALNLYEVLYMQVKAGGALNPKTFKQVYEEWKEQAALSHTSKQGSWDATIARIESYALKFFGSKRIDVIKEGDFEDYWAWRRTNYNKRQPTNSTLKRERTGIMPVFKFARAKGYLAKLPEAKSPKVESGRRPTFSNNEWLTIRNAMPGWVDAATELATSRDRFMAMHCFIVLVYSGLRPGELQRFRWRDISSVNDPEQGKYYVGHARGKTGPRQFVFQPGADVSLKLVYKRRCKELSEDDADGMGIAPDTNEPVFCHRDGSPIAEFRSSFRSLLKFAGVPVEVESKNDDEMSGPRSLYSFRHLYATKRLSKDTNVYLLASNMGTSVEMIEKHYGHVVNSDVAKEITKTKPMSIVVKGDIEFPF